jgi:hypothetical protein
LDRSQAELKSQEKHGTLGVSWRASSLTQGLLGFMRDANAGNTPLHCVRRNIKVRIKVGWNRNNASGEPG